ncbi:succinate dehydrogenase iron-sulfur subunit [Oceanithermus sp.]|uniref:succinate dehydrogenase iron-sulfur subunit n=1 Tax=Oceanithermus sp. TaxID=2268145 RepID=UPI0025E389C1|nr:succinate dehydrogenase iron-sulfur subunit [Oceanithermus sp.]
MHVTLKLLRYNPEADRAPHWESYRLEADPMDRVLDLLHKVKWETDGTLAFRRSCGHAICGSCAMMINGVNRLACKTLVKDLGTDTITIEPIRGLPVEKDLIVDMEPFFKAYKAVKPYFINNDPPPARERLQSPEEREIFDEGTKCILCAACTTSCPVFWVNGTYIGPSAIVNAHRFIFDSRDQGNAERFEALSGGGGVWRCRTAYNCTEACPREIPVTHLIEEVKRAIMFNHV